MAQLMLDSFDHYSNAELLQKWTQKILNNSDAANAVTAAVGARGTQGYVASRSAAGGANCGDKLLKTLIPGDSKCIVGFRFKCNGAFGSQNLQTTWNSTTQGICAILHLGIVHVWFRTNLDGTISAYKGDGTLLGTTGAALTQGAFHYLEFKVVISDTVGTVDVRIDNVSALSLTGQDTRNGGTADAWNAVGLGPAGIASGAAAGLVFDDLYIADGAGSTWNDFMGDMRIDCSYPNADGTNSDFAPSTGTDDYAVVDEALANGDTDHLSSSTVDHKTTLNFPDAPVPGADILGIQVVCQARKSDAGSAGHRALARISGTDYESAEVGLAASFLMIMSQFAVNPATSAAWTDAVFNGAEFGFKKSA